jgi:hypothetical protein
MMQKTRSLVAWSLIAELVVACGAENGGAESGRDQPRAGTERGDATTASATTATDAPRVEEAYQERIDEAWREAVAGENPAATCAGVKGRATAAPAGSATRALEACNVDIPARYFLAYVDRVEAGEQTCMSLMTEVMTKLPAMTISTEGFRDLAQQEGHMDESDAATSGAAMMAGAAASGSGANDPRQIVKERLRDRVTEVCPAEVGTILR